MIKENIIYSSITAGLKLVSGFFLLIFIARIVSIDEFGLFMYALTCSTLFGLFVDYGYQIKLLKDIPEDITNISHLISKALLSKLVVFVLSLAFLVAFAWVLSFPKDEVVLVIILLLGYVFGSFANTVLIPYKCTDRYNVESTYVFIETFSIVVLLFLISVTEANSLNVAIAFLLSKLIYFSLVLYRYRKEYGFERISITESTDDLKIGIPFAIHYIVGNLYLNVDTLIIKEFSSLTDVAIYQSGIRLVIGAGIVLTILNSVLTPRFVRFKIDDKNRLFSEVNYVIKIIFILGMLGVFVAFQFDKEISVLIYGDKYSDLSGLLPIFAIIIFIRMLGAIYGVLLTIGGGQKARAIAVLSTLALVITLDFVFVPSAGIVGAAYVLLLAHIVLLAIYLVNVKKVYSKYFILNY